MIRRACLSCNALTDNGSRCKRCQAVIDSRRQQHKNRDHYKGNYSRRAAAVRAAAEICWICGEPAKPNDPWTADHVIAGDPNSLLLAAHRSCNSRRGNRGRP